MTAESVLACKRRDELSPAQPRPLTARQRDALAFLRRFRRNRGRPPTVRELADHLGVACRKTAEEHLYALARKGHARLACAVRPSLKDFLPACRHCGRRVQTLRFGLCWACHGAREIRLLYIPARAATGLFTNGAPPPPDASTDAAPGSEEKLAVMEARAAGGRQIFHGADRGAPRHGWRDPASDGAA
jgi:sulfur relay (sulfurtransferase) DsrC/TusE family protein